MLHTTASLKYTPVGSTRRQPRRIDDSMRWVDRDDRDGYRRGSYFYDRGSLSSAVTVVSTRSTGRLVACRLIRAVAVLGVLLSPDRATFPSTTAAWNPTTIPQRRHRSLEVLSPYHRIGRHGQAGGIVGCNPRLSLRSFSPRLRRGHPFSRRRHIHRSDAFVTQLAATATSGGERPAMDRRSSPRDGDDGVGGRLSSGKKRGRRRKRPPKNRGRKVESAVETWRVFGVEVSPDDLAPFDREEASRKKSSSSASSALTDVGAERAYLTPPVARALASRLKLDVVADDYYAVPTTQVPPGRLVLPSPLIDARVVRRSLDARRTRRGGGRGVAEGPRYNYVIDVDVGTTSVEGRRMNLRHQPGRLERLGGPPAAAPTDTGVDAKADTTRTSDPISREKEDDDEDGRENFRKKTVVIVGAGPAGLFCALRLCEADQSIVPVVIERGQPVERRGRDIGALMHRRSMERESNFAFGEGGAGTWSDGKLTTRIGRNSDAVRSVLRTLVDYGAPERILVDGAPHLGTDNLVRLLRNMRRDLRERGGIVRFGCRMSGLHLSNDGVVTGVDVERVPVLERGEVPSDLEDALKGGSVTETIRADAVVLATGHSARDVYRELRDRGVTLEPKGFATGFRVEHPQSLINAMQYGTEWLPSVVTGRGATDRANLERFATLASIPEKDGGEGGALLHHVGHLPVASYRLATDKAFDGVSYRGAYSFCMCPGGQIVPASTDPDEVCVNGMSFSKRDSAWANSALVVTVAPDDPVLDDYRAEHGVLAGVAFQRDMERRAAAMGGGRDLVVPVQRLTDFVDGVASTSAPPSSYRLGVRPAPCHEIYPPPIVAALRDALTNHFDRQMRGFVCPEGLLHGVETRTSSPVRIPRDSESLQAIGAKRLFPAGEGAGFAGGIVSAACDGMAVADAVLEELVGGPLEGTRKKLKSVGFEY